MRWFKPVIRNSISALLGPEMRRSSPESLEPVRAAMLAVLGEEGAQASPELRRKLQYLHDAQSLWFARAEIVSVLSQLQGEALAVHRVQGLLPMFEGLVPRSLIDSGRARR